MPDDARRMRAIDAIGREPWLIEEGAFAQIQAIAERLNESPEAVATRIGRPLENARKVEMHNGNALIPITGPIFRYANLFTEISGATSLQVLAKDFQTALDAPDVSRIVLNLDTPGGQSTGIAEFANLVKAASAIKPVVAYVGDLAASAGYWIASHASEIVASPTAMLGSIGVVASYRPQKDGPIEIVSTQSPLKRADPTTSEGRVEAQRVVDQIAEVFVSSVASARGVSEEKVLSDFGRGSLLVGHHAVAAGMADRIASLESILAGTPGITPKRSIAMSEQTPGAPQITRAYLDTHHAELVAQIRAEGEAAGRTAGAESERQRISDVRAQLIPGHEALIDRLAADGHSTGGDAAMAVLAAEKALLASHREAIATVPPPVAAAVPQAEVDQLAERRARAQAAQKSLMAQVAGTGQ